MKRANWEDLWLWFGTLLVLIFLCCNDELAAAEVGCNYHELLCR